MVKRLRHFYFVGISLFFVCCSQSGSNTPALEPQNFKILSLGDSYTFGQSVCETCGFPEQLKDSLASYYREVDTFQVDVIAQTGWNTSQLLSGIASEEPSNDYDIVTLLIGVNNQFQGRPFSVYETDFPELVNQAITFAKGDKDRVIIISIPDYAQTPFGMAFDDGNLSEEIDMYNDFAESVANDMQITYVYVTDISRTIIDNPDLIASDGLHPSELAYSLYVERLIPAALEVLGYEEN